MDDSPAFVLFGRTHLLTLALILALSIWISRVAGRPCARRLPWIVAVLLIVQEIVKIYALIGVYGVPWTHSVPLDLCRINEFLCAFMLVGRSYRAFEVAYFWAMGGSVSALLTPALAQGFPHPVFISFFLGHGLVVLAVLYGVFGYRFWPRLRSVGMTLAVTAVYALIVAGLNRLLGTNYLFLRAKPETASLLDYLGPWPVYLFGLAGVTVLVCFLCYAPFALARRMRVSTKP